MDSREVYSYRRTTGRPGTANKTNHLALDQPMHLLVVIRSVLISFLSYCIEFSPLAMFTLLYSILGVGISDPKENTDPN